MSDTLYEYYTTGDDDATIIYGVNWNAQTFTIGTVGTDENHNITSVKLLLYRVGSPGTLTIAITAVDGDGKPTGADLTSGTTNGDTLTDVFTGDWREITLTPYELQASTQYAIIVKALSGDGSNYLRWRRDVSSPTYAGGTHAYTDDSGSSWNVVATQDCLFEEYGLVPAVAEIIRRPRMPYGLKPARVVKVGMIGA